MIEVMVSRVHHHGGVVQKGDLILSFDDTRVHKDLLAIHDLDAFPLQRVQNGQFNDVHSQRFVFQALFLEFNSDLPGHILGDSHFR